MFTAGWIFIGAVVGVILLVIERSFHTENPAWLMVLIPLILIGIVAGTVSYQQSIEIRKPESVERVSWGLAINDSKWGPMTPKEHEMAIADTNDIVTWGKTWYNIFGGSI